MAKMNLSTEMKQSHGHREQTCSCQGGRGERKIGSLGLADVNYCIWKEWAMKFCIGTGSYIQSLVMKHDRRFHEKNNVYIHITGSHGCTAEVDRTL